MNLNLLSTKKGILYFLILFLSVAELHAQTMYVTKSDNTSKNFTIDDIKKLSFSDGKIIITTTNESAQTYALTDIRNINFKNFSTRNVETKNDENSKLLCYPNPTNHLLNIEMPESEGQVTIEVLSTSGKTMIAETNNFTNELYSLNVSDLSSGIYICKIATENTTNITTFIKQ